MSGKIPKKGGAQAESEREAWGEGIPARIKVGKGAGVCYVCVWGGVWVWVWVDGERSGARTERACCLGLASQW